MDITDEDAAQNIAIAIEDSIKAYEHSKSTAISVYEKLVQFIDKKYKIKISVDIPVWIPTTFLERQLQIVKLLHDPDVKVCELADMLLVSSKIIDDDLKKLKGNDGYSVAGADTDLDSEPLQVMGQKLSVDFSRRKGKVSFPSTVHPLFLTFNLTQVITTLEGLMIMMPDATMLIFRKRSISTKKVAVG